MERAAGALLRARPFPNLTLRQLVQLREARKERPGAAADGEGEASSGGLGAVARELPRRGTPEELRV